MKTIYEEEIENTESHYINSLLVCKIAELTINIEKADKELFAKLK